MVIIKYFWKIMSIIWVRDSVLEHKKTGKGYAWRHIYKRNKAYGSSACPLKTSVLMPRILRHYVLLRLKWSESVHKEELYAD